MIGLKRLGLRELVSRDDGLGARGLPAGCLSWRTSQVDHSIGLEFSELVNIKSSRLCRYTPFLLLETDIAVHFLLSPAP